MSQTIIPYAKESVGKVSALLCEYRNTRDYQYLFSSEEWILAFIDTYEPQENFLVHSENCRNYVSLSLSNGRLCFTGDPFNDFNGFLNVESINTLDAREIVEYFFKQGYTVSWPCLFEKSILAGLREFPQGIIKERSTTSLKIAINGVGGKNSYNTIISKRALKMYKKFSNRMMFSQMFGDKINDNPHLLERLLLQRREKLITKKNNEFNPSFEPAFDSFVRKLLHHPSLWRNVFLDYCLDKETGKIVALSLNFLKNRSVICYLRAHASSTSEISYGLVLDCWSNNRSVNDGIETIDLTRGDESYKYRLGCAEYYLDSFEV